MTRRVSMVPGPSDFMACHPATILSGHRHCEYFSVLYAWNDFYAPLIYLQSESHWTVALGLQASTRSLPNRVIC